MQQLSPFTCRRINRLPKLTSVWEGDRRRLPAELADTSEDSVNGDGTPGDCILWVDGTQGLVRSLQMVPADTGHEAVVRALLQAIEHPQGTIDPARPRKIVVKDRELQFFLRGALKDLEIEVDYARELPLIDDIFDSVIAPEPTEPAALPAAYEAQLLAAATAVWQDEPWYLLNEQEVLAIALNRWNIETLYVSVLGMADVEYGLLLYRSLESLRQFREQVLSANQSPHELQQAFLSQNCLFINYEPEDSPSSLVLPGPQPVHCEFGSLHPLEGLRTELADEEAATFIVALMACHRFVAKYRNQLAADILQPLAGSFRLPNPIADAAPKTVLVEVKTLPEVSAELMQQTDALAPPAEEILPDLNNETIPDGSLILLSELSATTLSSLRQSSKTDYHAGSSQPSKAISWPAVIVQTTRPKAKQIIERLQAHGGISTLCFNPGSDPFNQQRYQLGIIQTKDGALHLFHEYDMDSDYHVTALEKWQSRQVKSQGHCAVVIAGGVTGAARGNPSLKQMLALFEAKYVLPDEIGLVPLVLSYWTGLDSPP